LLGTTGTKHAGGAVGVLTRGLVDRQRAYEVLLTYALAPLLAPEYWPARSRAVTAARGPAGAGGVVPAGAFEVAERTRWEDADLVGIVRYSAYTRLLDAAEAELFRAAGLAFPRVQEAYGVVLVRRVLHLEYHAPARFDAELRVAMWVARAGSSSLTLGAAVRDAGGAVVHAAGHVVVVAVDHRTLAKTTLPADLLGRLARRALTAVAGPSAAA
jgi:YbgC/YbaW family acyl-CoA thioester hydrolase